MKIVTKNKNKLKLEAKSKILVLGLILIVLVGIFGLTGKAESAGKCYYLSNNGTWQPNSTTQQYCVSPNQWSATQPSPSTPPPTPTPTPTSPTGTPGSTTTYQPTAYTLLAPLPDPYNNSQLLNTFDPTDDKALGKYLNLIIKLIIGLSAVMAVVMIVIGGIEYMTSELISGKEAGRERMLHAVLGLLIALGAWALLNTINPDLLESEVEIPTVIITEEPEPGIQGKTISVGGSTLTACNTAQMETISLFGTRVTVNKAVVGTLKSIDAQWNAMPTSSRYKISSIGGYSCRAVTGKPGYWSAHAFGLALDINPSTNPYSKTLITNMPQTFINLFTNAGWGWGGAWVNVKDAMHFSSNNT